MELQPYLTAISAALSVATLGFILNLVKIIRDNAQERIAIQDERLKHAAEDQQRTEKWAEREKASLKEQLDEADSKLTALLSSQGIDLANLTLGRQLSDAAGAVRQVAEELVKEIQDKMSRLASLKGESANATDPNLELTLAMGSMAYGSFASAAAHFDAFAKEDGDSWQTSFTRGIAHANSRGGPKSNLASLRAYNDAIALAPPKLDPSIRARMFGYRGAIFKRLNRLDEAKSDLAIGLNLATESREIYDIRYNLACVYAMLGQKEEMLKEIMFLRKDNRYIEAIKSHAKDYFKLFSADKDYIRLVGV